MIYQIGDIVKFICNEEPCVVYRVVDDKEVMMDASEIGLSRLLIPHIRIEAIGYVPVELLVAARSVAGNKFALDQLLSMKHQLN